MFKETCKVLLSPRILQGIRLRILILNIVTLFGAAFDLLGIALLYPYTRILFDKNYLSEISEISQEFFIYHQLKIVLNSFELIITVAIILSFLMAALIRSLIIKLSTNIAFELGGKINSLLVEKVLSQDYIFYKNKNTIELIDRIISKSNGLAFYFYNPLIWMISSGLILLGMFLVLITISYKVTLVITFTIIIIYSVIVFKYKLTIKNNSKDNASSMQDKLQVIYYALSNIREIILSGNYKLYIEKFKNADYKWRRSQTISLIGIQIPRYFVEALGLSLIVVYIYLSKESGHSSSEIFGLVGIIALSFQKIMPLVQQFYSAYGTVRANLHQTHEVSLLVNSLGIENERIGEIGVEIYSLDLNKVSFKHGQGYIFRDLTLSTNTGGWVWIQGASGQGKSTVLEIIAGLLTITSGEFVINQGAISYQDWVNLKRPIFYLSDDPQILEGTAMENIVLFSKSNDVKLNEVMQVAGVRDIEAIDKDLNYKIQSKGLNLSRGQRQRIGIARALYSDTSILILDEAMSGLDIAAEQKILNNIKAIFPRKIVFYVGHRGGDALMFSSIYKIINQHLIQLK